MDKGGRPTLKEDPEVNRKIDEAAAFGASIEEIAFYIGVHRDTLYGWTQKDKDLLDRIKALQERPILKARQTVVKALDDPEHAKWYLERKRKKEFSQRNEFTGAEGEAIAIQAINYIVPKENGGNNIETDDQATPSLPSAE